MKLSLENLAVAFSDPQGGLLPALGPVSLAVGEDEFVCLIGPSGCGKTTLIRVLAGLQAPTSGIALCDGVPIARPMRGFAIMFQEANLMPWRTVLDNIALPLEVAGVPAANRYKTVRALLPLLQLENFDQAYPAELSGGMAQRVALGRVMVQEPQVWLLDEPFGALDALTREKLSLELLQLRSRTTQIIIMVTHNISEAVLLADRVIVLSPRPGRLVADVRVDLPRPRFPEMIYERDFLRLAKRIRASIDEISG